MLNLGSIHLKARRMN